MGAANTVGKAVAVLAMIMLFINLIIPGGNPAWAALTGAMQTPFPQFINPFDSKPAVLSQTTWMPIEGNKTYASSFNATYGSDHGCKSAAFWDCINDPNGADENTSVLYTSRVGSLTGVLHTNLTGTNGAYLTAATVEIWCNTPAGFTPAPLGIVVGTWFHDAAFNEGTSDVCRNPSPGAPFPVTYVNLRVGLPGDSCANSGVVTMSCIGVENNQLYFDLQTNYVIPFPPSGAWLSPVNVSFVAVHLTFSSSGSTACTTDFFGNFGCQVGAFFSGALKVGLFIVNGLIFVGSVVWWFLVIVGSFLYGLLASLIWILAIPAPYSPPPVIQAIIDVFVLGLMASILIIVISEVRGTGTVPV